MEHEWTISGAKLRRAREKAGYPTQAKAARDLGMSRSRLNNWECGVSQPPTSQIARLMSLYGVRFLSDLMEALSET